MSETDPQSARSPSRLRLILLGLGLLGLLVLGRATGLSQAVDPEAIRSAVREAGPLGVLLFAAVFAAGEFIHIPGMVFVAAGILAYGELLGFFVSLLAAIGSVCFSFAVVRALGGKALTRIQRPFLRRMLAQLDSQPIRTVVVLRLLLWLAPALNYALALSSLRFRDYLIGSAFGLILPIACATLFFEWFFG